MTQQPSFKTFKEISREYANWGRNCETKEWSIDAVSLGCLMRIADVVETIAEALAKVRLTNWQREAINKHEDQFGKLMAAQEKVHGKCDTDLRNELYQNSLSEVCTELLWRTCGNSLSDAYIRPPQKGTPLRREYDRWMKRRCKTKTEERMNQ